jgi:hypothetical protein
MGENKAWGKEKERRRIKSDICPYQLSLAFHT